MYIKIYGQGSYYRKDMAVLGWGLGSVGRGGEGEVKLVSSEVFRGLPLLRFVASEVCCFWGLSLLKFVASEVYCFRHLSFWCSSSRRLSAYCIFQYTPLSWRPSMRAASLNKKFTPVCAVRRQSKHRIIPGKTRPEVTTGKKEGIAKFSHLLQPELCPSISNFFQRSFNAQLWWILRHKNVSLVVV